jgi:hypothetical protein
MPTHSLRRRAIMLGLILPAFFSAFGGPAAAQSGARIKERLQAAVGKVQAACGDDVRRYCSEVTPGEARLLLCMQAHEDKISPTCDRALFEASRNLGRIAHQVELAADACWNDIEKHCSAIAPGNGNVLQCLAKNKADVSQACQRAVSQNQALQ